MKNKKLIIGLSVALAVIIIVFGVLLIINRPETNTEAKQITVTVVYEDDSKKEIPIETNAEFLGEALFEKKLISKQDFDAGYFIYFDGVRADYNEDSAWWCITKKGQMTEKGMNELPIANGDEFEITYTPS